MNSKGGTEWLNWWNIIAYSYSCSTNNTGILTSLTEKDKKKLYTVNTVIIPNKLQELCCVHM